MVHDQNGHRISIGDVLLFANDEKTLVAYAPINNGAFRFEVPPGIYFLTVSCLGFETHEQELDMESNQLVSVVLKEKATALEEVSVIAAKNPITYNNGNYKVDLTNPIFNAIPDALDVLAKLPNVQVAPDRESVTVLGKGGPLLYAENQRISFEEFIAIPLATIASIELINNPSAKYEAEGRAVLLITRKTNPDGGAQLNLSETAAIKRNFNNYLGANWGYSKNKLILQGNLSYNTLQPWESNGFEFEIPDRGVLVDYTVLIPKNNRVQQIAGLGLRYTWNNTDYISVNSLLKRRTDVFPLQTNTVLEEGNLQQSILTNAENNNGKDFSSTNLNFNIQLDSSTTVFAGLQYSYFLQELGTRISNSRNASDAVLEETREQRYELNSIAGRLDFEKNSGDGTTWEAGLNWNYASADAFSQNSITISSIEMESAFDYGETVFAAYSSLATKLGKNKDINLGLRLEHNAVDAQLANEQSPVIARKNTNLFPTIGLNMAVDSIHVLSFNFKKSIQRPDFSRTNSISVFINPFLEGTGNVNLRPSITDEVAFNYQWKKQSFSISLYRTNNPIYFTIGFDANLDTAVLSQVNLEKEEGFSALWTIPMTKGIWTGNTTANLVYNLISNNGQATGNATPYFYFYTDHQFKIADKTTFSLGGWALTNRKEGIFERNGLVVFNAAMATTLFKKWECALRFNDITRAMNFEEAYNVNGVRARGTYFADGREIALSLKYRFGAGKKATFKNKEIDGNLNRID